MSGIFVYTASLLSTVIGDPSQNAWCGGTPRGPIKYPNGTAGAPELGDALTGEALTAANNLVQYHKARIYWLGNEQLAAKYGTTTPSSLTPVEEDMWARQVAVLQYTMNRIDALMGTPPTPLHAEKQELTTEKKSPSKIDELVGNFRNASPEERAELLKILINEGAR